MKSMRTYRGPLIKGLAWLSLLAAFIIGQQAAQSAYQSQLSRYLPGAGLTLLEKQPGMQVYRFDDPGRAVLLADDHGYGGPISVAIQASRDDSGARIDEVALLDNRETPPYIDRLVRQGFFSQFQRQQVTGDFILGGDIDGYSGATITARGVTAAVARAVHHGAQQRLGLPASWQPQPWSVGIEELLTLTLVIGALYLSSRRGSRGTLANRLKLALPLASLLFIGFYVNASISISSLYTLLLGYLPTPQQHPLWWILMLGIGAGVLLMGRNIYCHKLCPFGAIQSQLSRISGINLKVPPRIAKAARPLVLTLIWASLMLVLLSRHPALGSYEPFSMMFSLEGMGIQWYVLPLSLFGAFFIGDFWCRFFCPVGLTINESVKLRRKASQRLSQIFNR